MNEWISICEKEPENGDAVLAMYTDGNIRVAYYTDYHFVECWDVHYGIVEVTHWMPLPEPPKED